MVSNVVTLGIKRKNGDDNVEVTAITTRSVAVAVELYAMGS